MPRFSRADFPLGPRRQIVEWNAPDLTEVFRGGHDFAFRGRDVLLAAGDDENWFLPAHRRLDVRVRFRS